MEMLKATPFSGKEEYEFVGKEKEGNVYSDCSVNMIGNLKERNIISPIDDDIIDVLYRYRILNFALLNKCVECNQLSKHLNKLREYGILLYFVNPSGQGIYTLSEGANIYKELEKNNKYKRNPSKQIGSIDGSLVSRYICSNAAYINSSIRHQNRMKKLKVKKTFLRKISIKGKFEWFQFMFVSVRRNEKNYNYVLEAALDMDCESNNVNYLVLVCEDFRHFDEINDELEKANIGKLPCILYTTDRGAYDNVLNNMYVKKDGRYLSINFSKM